MKGNCPVCWGPVDDPRSACNDCWSNRVRDIQNRERLPVGQQVMPSVVTAVLHIGFVTVLETEEQLRRLPESQVASDSPPARSKISKSQFVDITPIDRVASRVVTTGG